jgi:hypothetical protein
MFLVQESSPEREARIKKFLCEDASLAALLSVIHFEWTIRRAIIALSSSPNVEVREKLSHCHGCEAYKDIWKEEAFPKLKKRLPEVITDWQNLRRAFKLRHKLVHGVTSCSHDHAKQRAEWAIQSSVDIREICKKHNIDLDARLPVRKRKKVNNK